MACFGYFFREFTHFLVFLVMYQIGTISGMVFDMDCFSSETLIVFICKLLYFCICKLLEAISLIVCPRNLSKLTPTLTFIIPLSLFSWIYNYSKKIFNTIMLKSSWHGAECVRIMMSSGCLSYFMFI